MELLSSAREAAERVQFAEALPVKHYSVKHSLLNSIIKRNSPKYSCSPLYKCNLFVQLPSFLVIITLKNLGHME